MICFVGRMFFWFWWFESESKQILFLSKWHWCVSYCRYFAFLVNFITFPHCTFTNTFSHLGNGICLQKKHRRPRRCWWFTYVTVLRYVSSHLRECMKIVRKSLKEKKLTLVYPCVILKCLWQLSRSKVVKKPFWRFKLFPDGKQTWKSLNRQNGFVTTLKERLSCHRHFKITQA